ncbi:MAG TPA: bifunctional [glutamine synthetase] adenylyltransferase/[glutamine synthetase]-adenylyl-L-tyrosine phosphorylase [Actinomycetota bacterium]|nr:bifunctional [glutamine synthetase] adenylyltransferase/[glutamine synthetase]-adenylyl-L-tyrosine phosphorylase [Actinomycetota bacterium]
MEPTQSPRIQGIRAYSRALMQVLDNDAEALELLMTDAPLPRLEGYLPLMRRACESGGIARLRRTKHLRLLEIAARDLAGEVRLEEATRALSDLADACLQVVLEHAGLSGQVAVIGMGKLGAQELNYASDIDLMFVAADDSAPAARAAEVLLEALGSFVPEGQPYRVDVALRPEGRAGALVRSLDGYLEYYSRWAKPWEFQALIKARPCAGDQATGSQFIDKTREFVYAPHVSDERVASIRRMKERVESHAASVARRRFGEADDVKRGPGGIRDIEFSVQLLQLVHGAGDPEVRVASTLGGLDALLRGGYIAEDDGAGLEVAYRWLRAVEHRLQLWQMRQVHTLPSREEDLSRLARSLGFKDTPAAGAAERFLARHRAVLVDVRSRFEKLFYRPMIEALAEGGRLSPEAIRERLHVLGFRDVERAARTLQGLVSGTSRRAKLFQVLSPAFLRFVAASPQPDAGLFAFLRLGESLGVRLDALGAFRDNPPALALAARILGSGRMLGEWLETFPDEIGMLTRPEGPPPPKSSAGLRQEARASLEWRGEEGQLAGLRRFRRREMLRVALADVGGSVSARDVGVALSDLADACIEAALEPHDVAFAVIGMGKLGGRELNYPSDVDVMFVYEGDRARAEAVGERLRQALSEITPEGQALALDLGLRPEGKAGPVVRSLGSFLEYYDRWAKPWEHQALIKARFCAGDEQFGARFLSATRRHAFPSSVGADHLAEIRHLKARMERERVPRGIEPRRHLKMGPGGQADVEFAAQLLQLRHAAHHPALQVGGALEALDAARSCEVIGADAHRRLTEAYDFLARMRNRLFLITGRAADVLPGRYEDLEALGISLGFQEEPRQQIEETYLRLTRRARRAAEAIIYG